uniref:Uncharacterized protein n=1 Tax=Arundo donax TaxID=35708 RepID=A0A0A9CHT2_ARUDO
MFIESSNEDLIYLTKRYMIIAGKLRHDQDIPDN